MKTEKRGASTSTALIVICIIALLGAAGLSALLYQQNETLNERASSLNRDIGIIASLERLSEGREVQAGLNYLASNYNPHLGLISETSQSDVFWLYSDNFLAALAINSTGLSNSTLTAISDNVSATLHRYSSSLGTATNQYSLLSNYWNGPCGLGSAKNYAVASFRSAKIMVTLNNGSGKLPVSQYADVAFLQAVCSLRQGNSTGWSQALNEGVGFFNGVGFNDTAFQTGSSKGTYQTYKLALFIYAFESECGPFSQAESSAYQEALTILLQMQAPDGGFYTGYSSDLSINGTANAETTSLAVLAMSTVTYCM